jgi:hypothetical protein
MDDEHACQALKGREGRLDGWFLVGSPAPG